MAEGARSLQRCFADVAMCGANVGIIAWRYGHVLPENEFLPTGQTPPSGTTLGRTSIPLNTPVLMFRVDPAFEWPSAEIDALQGLGDAGKAVALLRQDVGQNFMVNFFRNPEELAGPTHERVKVYTRLTRVVAADLDVFGAQARQGKAD